MPQEAVGDIAIAGADEVQRLRRSARFAAIAPRVANETEMMVATITSARMPIPANTVAPVIDRIRSIQAR